jgi:predicted dehydrogenase
MYKVALVGCGRISFKHIEAFVNNSAAMKMVTVCDPVIERAGQKAKEYEKNRPV